MSEQMSKEDMVKEAVEEAKAKAAGETAKADGSGENGAGAEGADTASETANTAENGADPAGNDADAQGNEADGDNASDMEADGEEQQEEVSGEEGNPKAEKKKLFGKKNKKDKKDEKIDELTDRLPRQMAEFENFRKRNEKEKSQMYENAAKDIIEKILPIVDNFERGLASMPEDEKATPFAEGMEKIYKQLMTTLEGIGVKPIEAVGQEFNPDFHNAVMHVEDEELGENIIAEEFQKGYMYRDSVVRHSMVKVAN